MEIFDYEIFLNFIVVKAHSECFTGFFSVEVKWKVEFEGFGFNFVAHHSRVEEDSDLNFDA